MAKRKSSGAFGGEKFKENNAVREPGTFHKFDDSAKVAKLGTKTKSDGFAMGGAIDEDGIARMPEHPEDKGMKKGGAMKKKHRKDGGSVTGAASTPSLAKRARGGRTLAPFSNVHTPVARQGSSQSGHEGE